MLSPLAIIAMSPTGAPLTDGQAAVVTALSILTGGVAAGLAGGDAQAGATWAENEATNNSEKHTADILKACLQSSFCSAMLPAPAKIAAIGYVASATGSSKDDSGSNLPQLPDSPGNNDDDLSGGSQGQHVSGFALAGMPIPVCVPYAGCTFVMVPVPTSGSLPNIGAIFSTGNGSDSGTSGDSTNSANNDATKGGVNSAPSNVSGADSAANAANSVRLNNQLAAEEIANGHAFDKHVIDQNEFGGSITTQQQFANQIENILNNPSATKQLSNGRSAYWDDASGMVVIRNPNAADGGTAFKPTNGKSYFNNLR
ncbi:VENN motif pre-toxin domain-containing protein [Paraburkholderia phenoliruptrix]